MMTLGSGIAVGYIHHRQRSDPAERQGTHSDISSYARNMTKFSTPGGDS